MSKRLRSTTWFLLPVAYVAACILGIKMWLMLGSYLVVHCPPDKVWVGLASGNTKCSWPSYVFLIKDGIGATFLAISIIVACACVIAKEDTWMIFPTAMVSAAIGILYTLEPSQSARTLSHRIFVGAIFAAALVATATFVEWLRNRRS